ncbi:MAG: type I-C CRISPR-associated protein Cas8c/Csd1 [Akkermansiaceae bacterium]|jgi:CRISPR-associated protein Csd1|nr:type I-C CRISPR-associated protein Cas8c/Csd1 [Akkermansiaceae bacterium]
MILQSLNHLYRRLAEDPDNGLPTPGYSLQNITFCIVIREDGTVVQFLDARKSVIAIDKNGKERSSIVPIEILVPGQSKSSGQGINPCTLWDNLTYLAGYPQPDRNTEKAEKNRIRAPKCFEGSRDHHVRLFAHQDVASSHLAVARYFTRYTPVELLPFVESLPEDARKGNGVFQLSGETSYAHKGYRQIEQSESDAPPDQPNQCLVTGKNGPIARLHEPKIKTFDPKGSLLVSFNEAAYESYGKTGKEAGQGRNSPVSDDATFAYCNALNWLLARKERRFRIGDATAVFWTAEATPAEALFPALMSGVPDAEDQGTKQRVHDILEKISRGTLGTDELGDPNTEFFILGLSPNASRLSVRFWHTGTLRNLIGNLKLHLNQLELVRQWDETNSKNPEPVRPSSYQLLRQTARDADGIPPLLGGALMRSILLGAAYPSSLITAVQNRIRAERDVSYLKAAILKAWLIRNNNQNITTMLDETNTNPGYRLGRLFAVLEKAQQDALPGINSTIRDRFYASASATPRAVFGRLLRTYQHHLGKLDEKLKGYREKQTQEILAALRDFPAHLNLENQAQFALGYYHQRKDFFTKKETQPPTETANV